MRMRMSSTVLGLALVGVVLVAFGGSVAVAGATALPDERAYELVSPLANGEVFEPPNPSVEGELGPLVAYEPFRAALDGNGLIYAGDAPGSGIGGNGNRASGGWLNNEYLARRAPAGWSADDIEPPPAPQFNSSPVYQGFSDDLSTSYLASPDMPPLAGAPHCLASQDLYSRSSATGDFAALFTSTLTNGKCGRPLYAGASADGSHVLFQDEAALVAPATDAAGNEGEGIGCYEDCNLYESVNGLLRIVNILPDGSTDPAATFGGPSGNGNSQFDLPNLGSVISADGSRVVWSDVNTGVIYVRKDDLSTVQASAGRAKFWTASVDGRFVFYTEGEHLMRFDVQSEARADLVGAAGVQGVLGTSGDGSYVYVVANGALVPGTVPGTCEVAPVPSEERKCNLYVLHSGEPVKFIATLTEQDNANHVLAGLGLNERWYGDWQANLGSRTAEVTPDGRAVAFRSTQPLTGYENIGPPGIRIPELFVYENEVGGGRLYCASCDPSGASPTENVANGVGSSRSEYQIGAFVRPSIWETYLLRWISNDGSRVFFDTAQPLVGQDTNGLEDVYEWERGGSGSCQQPNGCVYLLSGGRSTDESLFLDTAANGNDVFFMTRAQLVSGDHGEDFSVYDARAPHVPGEAVGFTQAAGAACSGSGCQGAPPAPPAFGPPTSATFSGAGNVSLAVPAGKTKAGPRKKKAKACRRGQVRRRGKCTKSPKHTVRGTKAGRTR